MRSLLLHSKISRSCVAGPVACRSTCNFSCFNLHQREHSREEYQPLNVSPNSEINSEGDFNGSDSTLEAISSLSRFGPNIDLGYESDVLKHTGATVRLVDRPENATNVDLWIELIQFRARQLDSLGVCMILRRLRRSETNLPTEGPEAHAIWRVLFDASYGDGLDAKEDFWRYVLSLYKRTDKRHEALFEWMVGYHIQHSGYKARKMMFKLATIDLSPRGRLDTLVAYAVTSVHHAYNFRFVYEDLMTDLFPDRIYDLLIPRLCENGWYEEAAKWDKLLTERGDQPSRLDLEFSLLKSLNRSEGFRTHKGAVPQFHDSESTRDGFSRQFLTQEEYHPLHFREKMNLAYGSALGIKPKTISDEFCARAFATRLLSPSFVMNGLAAFGLRELGPLALRELATRCTTSQEVLLRLSELKQAGISLQETVYTRLVSRLSFERKLETLQMFLQSDQHPENWEDEDLQFRILNEQIRAENWGRVRHTLEIFKYAYSSSLGITWNNLLIHLIQKRNWEEIDACIDGMVESGTQITLSTLRTTMNELLHTRKKGSRPPAYPKAWDDTNLLSSIWLKILKSKHYIDPTFWHELTRRYGMEGRLGELARLAIQLVEIYKANSRCWLKFNSEPMNRFDTHTFRRNPPLRRLFSARDIMSIIEWGFVSMGRPLPARDQAILIDDGIALRNTPLLNASDIPTNGIEHVRGTYSFWHVGVVLARRLHDLGVPVTTSCIRSACRQRLRTLYGGLVSRLPTNQLAARNNPFTLGEMIDRVNRTWHEPVFAIPTRLLREETDSSRQELRNAVFDASSRPWIRTRHAKRVIFLANNGQLKRPLQRYWLESPKGWKGRLRIAGPLLRKVAPKPRSSKAKFEFMRSARLQRFG